MLAPHAAFILLVLAQPSATVPEPTTAEPTVQTAVPEPVAPVTPIQTVEPSPVEPSPLPVELSPLPVEPSPSPVEAASPMGTPLVLVAPSDTAAPIADERPLAVAPAASEPSLSDPVRRGALVGLSLGFVGCRTRECGDGDETFAFGYGGGALGQLELGYRFGRLAPVISAGIGGGPIAFSGDASPLHGNLRFVDVDAGVLLFLLERSRFDPYLGLRMGYARSRFGFGLPGTDIAGSVVYSRLGARITAGFGFYLGRHATLGPRFDLTLPFRGGGCAETSGGGTGTMRECFPVTDMPDELRSELPRWWSLSLNLHVVLPRAW